MVNQDIEHSKDSGYEGRLSPEDPASLRLWLRMMTCTKIIEDEIRRRLRTQANISLARFDYMAQLYRYPSGLKMGELSNYLMVTGGNITGLTDELSREGLVSRKSSPTDRRAWLLKLTPKGKKVFEAMAKEHNEWIAELFDGLNHESIELIHHHLGLLRKHLLTLS